MADAERVRSGGRHHDAIQMLTALGRNEQVLSTNHVVGETWTFLRHRDGHATAVGLLDRVAELVERGRLVIAHVTQEQEAVARTWLRRHDEREYTFVDATSFAVMRERRVREALASIKISRRQASSRSGLTDHQGDPLPARWMKVQPGSGN